MCARADRRPAQRAKNTPCSIALTCWRFQTSSSKLNKEYRAGFPFYFCSARRDWFVIQLRAPVLLRNVSRRDVAFVFILFAVLVTAFVASPWPGGDDWETFQGAARRLLSGDALYSSRITHAYYSTPPGWRRFLLRWGFCPSSSAGRLFAWRLWAQRYFCFIAGNPAPGWSSQFWSCSRRR